MPVFIYDWRAQINETEAWSGYVAMRADCQVSAMIFGRRHVRARVIGQPRFDLAAIDLQLRSVEPDGWTDDDAPDVVEADFVHESAPPEGSAWAVIDVNPIDDVPDLSP